MHSGHYNGIFAMRDLGTGSHWSPLTGEGIDGASVGRHLAFVPSLQVRWGQWRRMHADTTVARPLGQYAEHFHFYRWRGNPRASGMIDSLPDGVDDRLEPFEKILGVRVAGLARAYPFNVLSQNPVVQDTVGTVPVVIFFSPDNKAGAAFHRMHGGRLLDFAAGTDDTFTDRATGSSWNLAGEAVSGPLAGERLLPVSFTNTDWYVWGGNYRASDIYFHPRPPAPPLDAPPARNAEIPSWLGLAALAGMMGTHRYSKSWKPEARRS